MKVGHSNRPGKGGSSRLRAWAPGFFLLAFSGWFSPLLADSGVRLLRSNESEVVVEVTAPDPRMTTLPTGETTYEIDDWARTPDIGAPELPSTGFQLGLPPGTRPELSVKVLASTLLPGGPPPPVPRSIIAPGPRDLPSQELVRTRNETFYGSAYPPVLARLSGEGRLRFARVVGVEVNPFRWDPSAGAVRLVRRMEVTVRFLRDQAKARAAEHEVVPPSEGPVWERMYTRTLLNGEQAKSWRRAPARWPVPMSGKAINAAPEFRIRIDRSGLYKISYSDLVAQGWPQGSTPKDQLAMVERFYVESDSSGQHEKDVPILVLDPNGNGDFDAGDDIIFFGTTIWEDPWCVREYGAHPLPKDRRYGRENVYFLTMRSQGGARMRDAGPSFLDRQDLTPDSTFVWTQRYEGDGVYMAQTSALEGGNFSLRTGIDGIRSEHFFWVGGGQSTATSMFRGLYPVRFRLPGFVRPVGLRLGLHGVLHTGSPALVSFWYVGAPGDTTRGPWPEASVGDNSPLTQTLNAEQLAAYPWKAGENLLLMQMPDNGVGGGLDWMEWTWQRNYNADQDQVAWSTETLSGAQEFPLAGFNRETEDSLLVFDLTDSILTVPDVGPVRGPRYYSVDAGRQIALAHGQRSLRVQLNLDGAPRTLLALAASALAAPKAIEKVNGSDLRTAEGADEQLVVITAPEFAQGIAPLVEQRRREGLSVRLALIQDVCDQFNGGRIWPTAIRSYLRYLFRARAEAPTHLLLVGDASNDFAHLLPSSDRNFVPTQTIFANAFLGPRELVSSDEWFVDNLSGSGDAPDFMPDMTVGRLPVGSLDELSAVVNKILEYGQFSPSDTWRNRGLFVADDEFSNRIGYTGSYQYHIDELIFRLSSRTFQQLIQREAGYPEFAADSFYVAAYMDPVPGLQRCCEWQTGHCAMEDWHLECINRDVGLPWFHTDGGYTCTTGGSPPELDNQCYGVEVVRPLLREAMNRGYLFVNFEGHANAYLMTHEYIFTDQPYSQRDPELLQNEDKPFFFLGFGCHLADFSSPEEGLISQGDCLSEHLLFQASGRGSIASLGSTAYEWLGKNSILNTGIMQAWFRDPPVVEGKTRWVLGEIVTQGKLNMLASWRDDDAKGQIATYTLLGDPSLPMEMGPPRLAVELNGAAWTSGNPVTAEAGSDTVRIRVALKDEMHLDRSSVVVKNAGALVPDSLYILIRPDSIGPADDRRLILAYNPMLAPASQDYAIEIRARDLHGQESSVTLPVKTQVSFQVYRQGSPTEIKPGDKFVGRDTLLVTVSAPTDLSPERLDLLLDGTVLAPVDRAPDDPRHWRLTAQLPADLSDESHTLLLRIRRRDGATAERGVAVNGSSPGQVEIEELYNFPNPFGEIMQSPDCDTDARAATAVYYTVSRNAESARLTIYTQSGRRIRTIDQAGPVVANHEKPICWDGKDADGDPVANGLYFYKLVVNGAVGRAAHRIERMARVR